MSEEKFTISKNFDYFNNIVWYTSSTLDDIALSKTDINFDKKVDDPDTNKTSIDNELFIQLWDDPDIVVFLSGVIP